MHQGRRWLVMGWALGLLAATADHAGARELAVEVAARPGQGCEIELAFATGVRGLLAARQPEVLELATLALLGERLGFRAGWDGAWLRLAAEGACQPLIASALAMWKEAGELDAAASALPAMAPPQTAQLRAEAPLSRALGAALGGQVSAASGATLLARVRAGLAEAPGRLRIRGAPGPAERAMLPRSGAAHLPEIALAGGTLGLPPVDGVTRVWVMWRLGAGEPGAALATLLGHRGHRLHERLVDDMGLLHTLEARWLEGSRLLVLGGSAPGAGHGAALERLFVELEALAGSLGKAARPTSLAPEDAQAVAGALRLAGLAGPGPRGLATALAGLTRAEATIVVEPAREDLDGQVTLIDAALIASWTAATLDLRCPAPEERRERARILSEVHGLSARRYLAMTRALGRDAERMRQLDQELSDRCAEDQKLRALLPGPRIVALHRELRCGAVAGADEGAELTRRRALFARFRVDSSAHRPLVAMARRSPELKTALEGIERRCPGAP